MKKTILAVSIFAFVGCSSANLDDVKAKACEKWKQQGFECIDYEGFQWGQYYGGSYGGALVWHRLRKIPDNGITYSGSIQKWGNEYHVYGPKAVEAIPPK